MTRSSFVLCGLVILSSGSLGICTANGAANEPGGVQAPGPPSADEMVVRRALVIEPVGRYGRAAIHTDAIEAAIVTGHWSPPTAGPTSRQVALPDGTSKSWTPAEADDKGWFTQPALRGGYAYVSIEMPEERVMLLEATGHRMVYVNGRLRAGDSYSSGIVRLPVLLTSGTNHLLFRGSRGRLKVGLRPPDSPIMLDTRDATLPDLRIGRPTDAWAAVVLVNATTERIDGLLIETSGDGLNTTQTPLPATIPLSIRKVGFRLAGPAPSAPGDLPVTLKLLRGQTDKPETLATATITLRVRKPEQSYKVTFRSGIDDSVQYYAVNPAQPGGASGPPALFLTLHGAGVKAIGQADAYAAKSWGHIVAPTNRRPFGFDWEDWGRIDALEVLDHARQRLKTDPQRTYLTGHSMGGHGVWHLGATFPDRFAAIGPSAGWISFWSYSGAERYDAPTPIEAVLRRATSSSDTLALARNYLQQGVYILHGADDDNVPVAQAREMRSHLEGFHRDFTYYERPETGHWWDASDEPGTDCVDWAPMFDFFAHHRMPPDDSVRHVSFTTANPGISAWSHWVGIEAQQRMLEPASVEVRFDPGRRRFVGTTQNVARLALSLRHVAPDKPLNVELDGQKIEDIAWPGQASPIRWHWEAEKWSLCSSAASRSPALKGPHRYGPFKDAFRNRVIFIYATEGNAEENAWALAKARYDAETFWYRGNASVDIVADVDFKASQEPDRNAILYGNADTNAAWEALLAKSPIVVRRGRVVVGQREIPGEDLACLFIRPRPDSRAASVGVIGGSGLAGMRLTDRMPYFVSGVAYPDWIVVGADALTRGTAGVRGAGFFGLDWSIDAGDTTWATDQ